MKEYLGDGVYIDFDGFQVVLTAENGISVTSTIYLDQAMIRGIIKFVKKHTGLTIS
jgi:hypothetical protein